MNLLVWSEQMVSMWKMCGPDLARTKIPIKTGILLKHSNGSNAYNIHKLTRNKISNVHAASMEKIKDNISRLWSGLCKQRQSTKHDTVAQQRNSK